MADQKSASSQVSQLLNDEPPSKPKFPSHWSDWTFELIAISISILSFAGLAIALRFFDGQAQQDWRYGYFTRNTVVAAIATITRTALIAVVAIALSQNKWAWFSGAGGKFRKLKELETYDNASRGIVGSLQLLGVLKFRQIASLGAVVTILALAFDTFAQNVLGIKYREQIHTGSSFVGSFPRSEIYGTSYSIRITDWFHIDIPFDIKAALSRGVLGVPSSIPAVSCSTGNCTFPIVPSLAMCGGCTDITPKIVSNCFPKLCNYSLPDGTSLLGPISGIKTGDMLGSIQALFNVSGIAANTYSQSQGKPGQPGPIYAAHFSAIGTEVTGLNTGDGLSATECSLWFCLQAYNVSVTSGVQNLSTILEWSTADPWDEATSLDDELKSNATRNFTNIPSEANVSPGTVFGASYANSQAISSHFASLVEGTVSWSPHFGVYDYSSDGAQSIWQSRHNLSSWIQNVADSLTVAIRNNGTIANPSQAEARYAGVALSTQAYVHVRWIWMVYPCAMLVFGTVHLMVTIWQTLRGSVSAWKTSPLVPLLLNIENEYGLQARLGPSGRVSSEVEDLEVSLQFEDQKSWHMVSLSSMIRGDRS